MSVRSKRIVKWVAIITLTFLFFIFPCMVNAAKDATPPDPNRNYFDQYGNEYRYNGELIKPVGIDVADVAAGVNMVRAKHGLSILVESYKLDASAQAKAIYMCQHNFWDHGDWVSFLNAVGYQYSGAAENLAYGYSTAEQVVQAWENSPTHYRDMVGDYSEMGLSAYTCPVFQGQKNAIIVVNHFGKPTKHTTPVASQPALLKKEAKVVTDVQKKWKIFNPQETACSQ